MHVAASVGLELGLELKLICVFSPRAEPAPPWSWSFTKLGQGERGAETELRKQGLYNNYDMY